MTVTQLDIFDSPGKPGGVRTTDPHTSHLASEAVKRFGGGQRGRVLAALDAAPEGLTDFELSLRTGIPRHVAARRRKDLEQAGLVVATDRTRPTDTGCLAVVWRVA